MKILNYKSIPIKNYKNEGLYSTGKVDYEDYFREHADELDNSYHPVEYANFSIDFLREISTLNPKIDVRIIITYWYNDWCLINKFKRMYEWILEDRPELLEFFNMGIKNE